MEILESFGWIRKVGVVKKYNIKVEQEKKVSANVRQ
jgi:hypothetical protein